MLSLVSHVAAGTKCLNQALMVSQVRLQGANRLLRRACHFSFMMVDFHCVRTKAEKAVL